MTEEPIEECKLTPVRFRIKRDFDYLDRYLKRRNGYTAIKLGTKESINRLYVHPKTDNLITVVSDSKDSYIVTITPLNISVKNKKDITILLCRLRQRCGLEPLLD